MEEAAVQALAHDLLHTHGLWEQGWRFAFDRAVRRAGACHYHRQRITLSRAFAQTLEEAEIRETLLHEIAHALVGPGQGHNARWKATAQAIGCRAERTHSYEFAPAPWTLRCVRGCFSVPRHRRPAQRRLNHLRCARCGASIELKPSPEASPDASS